MNSKTTIILLGFALCLAQATFPPAGCSIRFFPGGINNDNYIYFDGDDVTPFTGWAWTDFTTQTQTEQRTYPSLRSVQAIGDCHLCGVTVFSTSNYDGSSQGYNFADGSEYQFPFDVLSFNFDCYAPDVYEEEITLADTVNTFNALDSTAASAPLVVAARESGASTIIQNLISKNKIPAGQYQVINVNSSEISVDFDFVYRFNLDISDGQGNDFNVVFKIVYSADASWIEISKYEFTPLN